jgi:hypothetical protein
MVAVGKTVIIKLVKEVEAVGGEEIQDNGLIAVGGNKKVEDVLSKWEGIVESIGEEVDENSPVSQGDTIRIMENSGVPISQEESETHNTRFVSVRYGDIIAVM